MGTPVVPGRHQGLDVVLHLDELVPGLLVDLAGLVEEVPVDEGVGRVHGGVAHAQASKIYEGTLIAGLVAGYDPPGDGRHVLACMLN